MAVVVGFHCDVTSCYELVQPRPAAAAESGVCGRGNAVGLTSILYRRQFFQVLHENGEVRCMLKALRVYVGCKVGTE